MYLSILFLSKKIVFAKTLFKELLQYYDSFVHTSDCDNYCDCPACSTEDIVCTYGAYGAVIWLLEHSLLG